MCDFSFSKETQHAFLSSFYSSSEFLLGFCDKATLLYLESIQWFNVIFKKKEEKKMLIEAKRQKI